MDCILEKGAELVKLRALKRYALTVLTRRRREAVLSVLRTNGRMRQCWCRAADYQNPNSFAGGPGYSTLGTSSKNANKNCPRRPRARAPRTCLLLKSLVRRLHPNLSSSTRTSSSALLRRSRARGFLHLKVLLSHQGCRVRQNRGRPL